MRDHVIILFLVLHLLLMILVYAMSRKRGWKMGAGRLLFCLLLPVFGPLCGLEMLFMKKPDPTLLKDLIWDPDAVRKSYTSPEPEAATTAPMEEAFLISTPQVRREMMMKLLHDDPDENLEILMMARFNDDPETAHYATATLTEYQRRMEMSLQESQISLSKQPDDLEKRLVYIEQLKAYIDSGLLEGHLLARRRFLLEKELAQLPEENLDIELGCLRAENLLRMKQAPDAIRMARELAARFPGYEEPWLMLMRIYVELQDSRGLKNVIEQIKEADIVWSYQGREKLEYFRKAFEGKDGPGEG